MYFLATEVAQDLRKYILEIYDDHLSSDGLVSKVNKLSILVLRYIVVYLHTSPTLHSCVGEYNYLDGIYWTYV